MLHPKIIRSLWRFEANPLIGSAVTIGSFDGLHLGHQQLINQVKAESERLEVPSIVLTFVDLPHWQFQQKPEQKAAQLMSLKEKCSQLLEWNIDYIICQYFNVWMRSLSAEDFVKEILVKQLAVKSLIIGDDFRFGNHRHGDYNYLQKMGQHYNFKVTQMPTLIKDNERVSSTRIRQLLDQNKITKTNQLLGRPYSISGRVVKGKQLGRTLGFPTANIKLKKRHASMRGVFVVKVRFQDATKGELWGVANLGIRPAINTLKETLLEVYLLDFHGDVYGQYLIVNFYLQLREEQYFDTIDDLKNAIQQDVEAAKKFIETIQ